MKKSIQDQISDKKILLGRGSNPQKYYFGGREKFKMHVSYFQKFDKIAIFFKSGKEWKNS